MATSVTVHLPTTSVVVPLGTSQPPAIGPLIQGATRPSWVVTVKDSTGSALDITGATFTGVLKHQGSSRSITCTVGSYSITDATAGKLTYAPVAADVAEPGAYLWETTMTISSQPYKLWALVRVLPDAT